jgi:hypothetical protein
MCTTTTIPYACGHTATVVTICQLRKASKPCPKKVKTRPAAHELCGQCQKQKATLAERAGGLY